MTYVLFDIGGTKTRVAISSDLMTLGNHTSFKTSKNFQDGMKQMIEVIETLVPAGEKVQGIAGGIRGPLNEEKTGIANDSALAKWAGKSVVGALKSHFDVPVLLENDTAIAGVGEAVFGAGSNLEIVVYHTVSTGVGGVKIENGVIDTVSGGMEPGHQILDIDRTILGEDITPTLENLVSGTAVEQRFGVKPYEIPQTDVLWDELAEYLAQGLRNTILYWSPDAIILGGSMIIGDPKIQIDAIRKYTVETLNEFVPCPFITTAKLGDEAGLYGAMALLSQQAKAG